MNDAGSEPIARGRLAGCAAIYALFVVYGSLLPFELRARSFTDALSSFSAIPALALGVGSRADWVANILLYMPLAFLGSAALSAGRPRRSSWLQLIAVFAACAALAVGIEFAQLYFPPRTVSQNDLIAEAIGSAAGIALWLGVGPRLLTLWQNRQMSGVAGLRALLVLYLVAYLALSFFPFDFLVSTAELQAKLSNPSLVSWGIAASCGGVLSCSVKLGTEVLVAMPIGALLALTARSWRSRTAFVAGLAIGALIEGGQLLVASGNSQGLSVLTRALGFAMGFTVQRSIRPAGLVRHKGTLRILVLAGTPLYVGLLAALNGFRGTLESGPEVAEKLAQANFLPFYYHYFTSETAAMRSLLMNAMAYACVGIGTWLLRPGTQGGGIAAAVAALLAMAMEVLKLLTPGQKPDPTNILIAAAAAWAANRLFGRIEAAPKPTEPQAYRAPSSSSPPSGPALRREAAAALCPETLATFAAGVILACTWVDPGNAVLATMALIAYVACVWREPATALFLFPVALGLTDVATYSGPLWFDWLDTAMLATAVLALLRPRLRIGQGATPALPPACWLGLGLVPGAMIGLQGLAWADPNALLTPLGSAWGAMQVKAIVWSFGLAWFVQRCRVEADIAGRMLGRGMVVALAGVAAMTIAERLAFVGPLDFSSDYRAPGPFSSIALGGAYIECFLVAATPFAVVAAMREPRPGFRWAALLLILAAAYATMVTYSRGGQVVFIVSVFAAAALAGVHRFERRDVARREAGDGRGLALVAGVTAVAAGILFAPYAVSRFEGVGPDARVRWEHWRESLGFGGSGWTAVLFGNGIGSYGRDAYFLGDPASRPGIFSIVAEGGNHFVRASQGSLSYLDQRVDVAYGEPLTVSARLRSAAATTISISICEKDLVQSRTCGTGRLKVPGDNQWHEASAPIALPFNRSAGWPARPIRLTLFHGGRGSIDVDDVALTDPGGAARIRNGSFENGSAHWLYASDRHLSWHVKNFWLHVFYEFGVVGVLAHAGLLLAGVWGAWRAALGGRPYFLAVAISLLTFQGIGLIDSLIDAPRFILLYLGLAMLGCVYGRRFPEPVVGRAAGSTRSIGRARHVDAARP